MPRLTPMIHIQQAIRDAVEKGGYPASRNDAGDGGYEWTVDGVQVPAAALYLDPSFWEALGKARVWGS